jgi:hypothetical protein
MVKVPTGGRKKKLNPSAETMEVNMASTSPHFVAAPSTSSNIINATVVALTGTTQRQIATAPDIPAKHNPQRHKSLVLSSTFTRLVARDALRAIMTA